MKIRNGFVSNSSSTAFILDRRKLDATTFQRILSLPDMDVLDRCTAYCSNPQAFLHAREYYKRKHGWDDDFADWIQEWINKIGNDNVVLCRESDEEMGGSFENVGLSYDQIAKLAESEMEYH